MTAISNLIQRFISNKRHTVVSSPDAAAAATHRGAKALLVGQAVYIALDESAPEGYVQANPILAWGDAKRVNRYIDARVVEELHDIPIAFAVDAYLSFGRKFKHDIVLLIGGAETVDRVVLELYVFERGKLKAVAERLLPSVSDSSFHEVFNATLKEFQSKHPISRTLLADPLPAIGDLAATIEQVGDAPFRHVLFFPMRAFLSSKSALRKKIVAKTQGTRSMMASASILAGSVLISLGVMYFGFAKLQKANAMFDQVAALPAIHESKGVDSAFLATLEARRQFLSAPPAQYPQADLALKLAQAAASIDGLKIRSIQVMRAQANQKALAAIEVAALKSDDPQLGSEALQGRDIARKLSAASGLSMRIDAGGTLARESGGILRWRIEIPKEPS